MISNQASSSSNVSFLIMKYTLSSNLTAIELNLFDVFLIILIDGSPFFIYVYNGKDENLNKHSSMNTIINFYSINILANLLNIKTSFSNPALNNMRSLTLNFLHSNLYTQSFILISEYLKGLLFSIFNFW